MKITSKVLVGAVLALAAASAFFVQRYILVAELPKLPPAQVYQEPRPIDSLPSVPTVGIPTSTVPATTTAKTLPASLRLNVPFIPQAPKQNWDMPYQEACEEASILMVNAYYSKEMVNPTPEEGDRRILDLVAWSADRYGAERVDMTAAETAEVASGYFKNVEATVVPFQDAKQLKEYLAEGYPIIVPADGKTLPNPNFRNGGPIYHMLVVKGYTDQGKWITNDPGTRKGENFLYEEKALTDAIHDWNGGDVPNGKRVILLLTPKK